MTDDPDRPVRLLVRSARGIDRTVLTLPASQMDECADWALEALRFDPNVIWKFEETSGRLISTVKPAPVAPALPPAPPVVEPVSPPAAPRRWFDLFHGVWR